MDGSYVHDLTMYKINLRFLEILFSFYFLIASHFHQKFYQIQKYNSDCIWIFPYVKYKNKQTDSYDRFVSLQSKFSWNYWDQHNSISNATFKRIWPNCERHWLIMVWLKACNENSEEQLPDFDSWALTAGILLNKVLFFSNKRTRLWL